MINRLQDFCNMNELRSLLYTWSKNTGLLVLAKDNNDQVIAGPYMHTDLCRLMQSVNAGHEKCLQSEENGCASCVKQLREFDFEIPLELPDGVALGKICGAQMRKEWFSMEIVSRVALSTGLTKEAIRDCIQKNQTYSKTELDNAKELLAKLIELYLYKQYHIYRENELELSDLMNTDYRIELEKALIQAKDAEKEKNDFLSRMSRDIRTPINSILGLVTIARDYQDDEAVLTATLDKIEKSGMQLEWIINDLLTLQEYETGNMEYASEEFSVVDCMEEVGKLFTESLKEKEINVIGVHYNVQHRHVYGCQKHLKKAMQNIVSNAVRYNKRKGSLEVWLEEEPIDDTHSMFVSIVKDAGEGMTQDIIDSIMDCDNGERNSFGRYGSGFGLVVSKRLIEGMDGTLAIESIVGEGTTVKCSVPFEIDQEKAFLSSIEEDVVKDLSGMNLLLAEDMEINAEIAEYLLSKLQAKVVTVSNGQEAVSTYSQHESGFFDAILMDVQMPEMDGHEATKVIRSMDRPDAKTIPIIAMTANAYEGDKEKSLAAGMDAHIIKPINANKLLTALLHYKK